MFSFDFSICFGSLPLFSLSCCFYSFPFCTKLCELDYILFERRLNISQTLTYKLNTTPNTVLPEPGVHGHKMGSKRTGRKKWGGGEMRFPDLRAYASWSGSHCQWTSSSYQSSTPKTYSHTESFVFIVSPWTPCPFPWILLAGICPSCQSLGPKSGQWPCGCQFQ